MGRRIPVTATVVLVALGLSPAAAAHGGGGAARGYSSAVTSVTPASRDVHVAVLEGDDRLQLRVTGRHVVVVAGYEGEPYLRFAPDGVYRNENSPATYLNDDRYGRTALPDRADPDAPPAWKKVAPSGRSFDWHDHRIHWMSPVYPPAVEAAKDVRHHIFDWTVTGTLDARPLVIAGTLDYAPLPGQRFPRIMIVPLVVVILAGLGVAVRSRLRGRRSDGRRV